MSSIIEKKKEQVQEVAGKFNESVSSVIVDYKGLTVSEMTELRSKLREENIEMKVMKNNISRRASEEANYSELSDLFVGTTAIAFSKEDVVAPSRILHNFSKEHESLKLKGGTMEDKVLTLDEVKELATLPSREGLLSMLLSVLQAPIRDLALVTQELSKKFEAEGGVVTVEEPKAEDAEEPKAEEPEEPKAEEPEEPKAEDAEEPKAEVTEAEKTE